MIVKLKRLYESNHCWKCIIYCTAIDSIFHAIWPIYFHSRPDVISLAMLLSFEWKWKDLGFIIQELTRKSLMTIKEAFNCVSMVFKKTDELIFIRAKFISLITSILSFNLSTIPIWNQKRRLVIHVWFASLHWQTLFLIALVV